MRERLAAQIEISLGHHAARAEGGDEKPLGQA